MLRFVVIIILEIKRRQCRMYGLYTSQKATSNLIVCVLIDQKSTGNDTVNIIGWSIIVVRHPGKSNIGLSTLSVFRLH